MYSTHLSVPQILALTEIVTEAPAKRAATKDKTLARLVSALDSQGISPDAVLAETFEDAKAMLLGDLSAAPKSTVQEKLDAVVPGAGGPGLTRFRESAEYQAIIAKTNEDSAAATALGVPVAEPKKAEPKKAAAPKKDAAKKADKPARLVISEEHVITEVGENPKRQGTKAHAIFSLYKKGMTTAKFIKACEKAGYTAADAKSNLSWDRRKGFITIHP